MSGNGSTQERVLRIDARDNVLVALANLRKGETISFLGNDYTLLSDVPAKHKFLTQDVDGGRRYYYVRPPSGQSGRESPPRRFAIEH